MRDGGRGVAVVGTCEVVHAYATWHVGFGTKLERGTRSTASAMQVLHEQRHQDRVLFQKLSLILPIDRE